MRDYIAWHDAYADPGSPVSRRLRVVIELISAALDATPAGPCRFVSLCAGQGDDVLAAAADHPRGGDLTGRLVELDPVNAGVAVARIQELGLAGIEVLTADAGNTDACEGAVPADLVVACRIFGNVSVEDIERTVRAFPSLCASGCWVVWTRHPREPGVLERVQGWLESAGFQQHAFVVDPEQHFAVGLHRLTGDPAPFVPGEALFTFVR